jgi:CheY-like chemotaxis protein
MPTRALVVEDSVTQAEALRTLFADAGYEVAVAGSGEDGLARFDVGRFDVVLSDIVMPGTIDGYELCRRIKAGKRPHSGGLATSLSTRSISSVARVWRRQLLHQSVEPALCSRLELLLTGRQRTRAKLRMG